MLLVGGFEKRLAACLVHTHAGNVVMVVYAGHVVLEGFSLQL